MKVWHYFDGKNTVGPFDEATIAKLIAAEMIGPDTQVSQNCGEWTLLADTDLKGFLPGFQPTWFYRQGDTAVGPFDVETFKKMVSSGILGLTSKVKNGEESEWCELRMTSLAASVSRPPNRQKAKANPVKRSRTSNFLIFMNRGSLKLRCLKWAGAAFTVWFVFSKIFSHSGTSQNGSYSPPGTDYRSSGGARSYSDSDYGSTRSSRSGVCEFCNGTGHSSAYSECMRCSGRGTITTPSGYETVCPDCAGAGRTNKCMVCGGTGRSL